MERPRGMVNKNCRSKSRWIVLMIREPLSSEKIWVKKIEAGEKV